MSRTAPNVWLNGELLNNGASARAIILAPLTITWGKNPGDLQPGAGNAKITFLFRESMQDLPDLRKGAQVEITDPDSGAGVFAGTVQTMSAKPSTKLAGGLEVEVNCADWLAELENMYFQPNYPEQTTRPAQITNSFIVNGWELDIPDDSRLSAATRVNSIKLLTVLERCITRYRGQRYDTSYRNLAGLHKKVSVFKGSARQVKPDKLAVDTAGRWTRQFGDALVDGVARPIVLIGAENILDDPSWSSGPEDAVTAAKISTVVLGEDGFSELTEHNVKAPTADVEAFGLRSIDLESDLVNSADWTAAAQAYFDTDAPWRMDALSIRDTDLLDETVMAALLSPHSRYQLLAVITDIAPNRPDPGPSDLRSFLAGGEFTWTGKKWDISLTLERTIKKFDGTADWWTLERVAAATTPAIRDATCQSAGNNLTVSDFQFIGAP